MRRLLSGALGFSPIGWLRDTRRMHRLVADFVRSAAPEATATRFAVVVMPWLGTAVPWFSLVCGLFLHAAGSRVTFIVDDLPFGPRPGRFAFVVACIRSVTRRLRRSHEVVALSSCASPTPLPRAALDELGRLAELNAVWALRGEMSAAGRSRYVERSVRQLAPMVAAVAHALEGRRFDAVFVPGGVYGASGVWATQARSLGIRVASFDSGGYGTLMVAADGVACQLQDIPRAFAMLKARPGFAREHAGIIAAARAEIDRRRSGTDKFTSQIPGSRTATEARFEGAVLIALNSSWDSAALGLHAVFDSSTAWIVETVRYLLQATTAPVVVRQHPAERLEIARTSDDYRALLRREFGDEPRLCFIAADEAVNSYDLLAQACAVVVYTSTLGIEAAAHGKVVVTASRSYYSDLGFVCKADDRPQYEKHLRDAVGGRCIVTDAMRDDALCCYYLTQCCNWVFSPFNPEGFAEWSRYALADLARHEKVQITVASLQDNVPVAYLNHVARLAEKAPA